MPLDGALPVFLLGVALSYVYAFIGGFTDAANAIATAVGTRAFSPRQAVLVAAVFELLGALTGTAVALTVGRGIVPPELLTQGAVIAALLGAMTWSLFTYRRGIPVSETHGLIGGIIGVGLYMAGADAIIWTSVLPVLAAIVVSPALGLLGGMLLLGLVYHLFQHVARPRAAALFRSLQRGSAMYMAFSHGRNDAQKPMGVLTIAIAVYVGEPATGVPLWVIFTVAAVAGLGVAAGGWRIIRTLGTRVTGLSPEQGFAAETSAATVLQVASEFGIPVSTTHTITSAIVGTGIARRWTAVRWELVAEIAMSWLLTLPATVVLGFVFAFLIDALIGR
ncbi:MAG: inorganic phosphate transporter [Candidatus Limnocylindria bacterium]